MKRFEFPLRLSPEQYLPYYRGEVAHVVVRCTTGATVQFPAVLLRPFISADGIYGNFVLSCDEQHKGARLQRVA
ncbi:MAG: hypothetical protein H6R19_358 [Proteobacteria bacterium]|nr:hypothetical protein [Pseudomonadota bacterium]